MTRINTLPPELLLDKVLLAEYRELPRVFTHVRKYGRQLDEPPENYVLGKGHVIFFCYRLKWLLRRYKMIFWELEEREFDLNTHLFNKIVLDAQELQDLYPHLWNYWAPEPRDHYENMKRLAEKKYV